MGSYNALSSGMEARVEQVKAATPTRRLREVIAQDAPFLLPGVYDSLGARSVERSGHPAVYVSGSAVAMSLFGFPDIGLVSATEILEQARRVVAACRLPVVCDADTGYGNPLNTQRTVRDLEAAGVAAVQLEDQEFPKRCGHFEGKSVISQGEMVAKLRAALDARRDPDFVIIARTDARAVDGLEVAINRALAYKEAGADVIFLEAPTSKEELEVVARRVPGPLVVNVVEGGKTPQLPFAEYAKMGYKIILYPTASIRAAAKSLESLFGYLRENGSTVGYPPGMVGFSERNEITRLDDYLALEKVYESK